MRKRIDFLDYLKAVSILLVIITHYEWPDKHGYIFTMVINMAVPIFIIISGYNFAMSNKKKTDGSIGQMYRWKLIWPKIERFIGPYIIIALVEWILLVGTREEFSYAQLVLQGGIGPGSYYVPLMIQFIGIFPLIYWMVDKHPVIGITAAGIVNLLYEIGIVVFEVEKDAYRLSIGRYILLVALGTYMYLHPGRKVKSWQLVLMMLVGMSFQMYILRDRVELGIFNYWKPTCLLIAFYIFPIIVILFRTFYHSHIDGKAGELMSLIGKGSYHIFLVQMVYYHFKLGGGIMEMAWYLAVPYNLVITVTVGLAFYFAESKLNSIIKTWRKKKLGNRNTCPC